ncbi:MAG: twin-arginine translocation signal domain-containing protein [Proteobacteria bacterium]|nr:twin-arginine translocation signal domain-containing protein [Pseudomonadota bacterium]
MRWTRRNFLQAAGGLAAVTGLGLLTHHILEGKAKFSDWRALPGMKLTLTIDTDSPESKAVDLVARYEGKTQTLGTLHGARSLEVEIPFIATTQESYDLTAIVYDTTGAFESEPVEVLSQPFSFGF